MTRTPLSFFLWTILFLVIGVNTFLVYVYLSKELKKETTLPTDIQQTSIPQSITATDSAPRSAPVSLTLVNNTSLNLTVDKKKWETFREQYPELFTYSLYRNSGKLPIQHISYEINQRDEQLVINHMLNGEFQYGYKFFMQENKLNIIANINQKNPDQFINTVTYILILSLYGNRKGTNELAGYEQAARKTFFENDITRTIIYESHK